MALSLFASPDFSRMEKALDRALGSAFGSFMPVVSSNAVMQPAACPCDIVEHKDKYIITAGRLRGVGSWKVVCVWIWCLRVVGL
jgi:hypothetical protein